MREQLSNQNPFYTIINCKINLITLVLAGIPIYIIFSAILIPLIVEKYEKTITIDQIPSEFKEIIVGIALGDLYIRKRNLNTSLNFKQSIKNKPYILHLYSLFQGFCIK